MKRTLAFDVYGTLIDTTAVVHTLRDMMGDAAQFFMENWRRTQLEYSFRRGLMHAYVDFGVVTREALDYCLQQADISLTPAQIQLLMDVYKILPAFKDVQIGLTDLSDTEYKKYAFSNGSSEAVAELLKEADLTYFFDGVVSVAATRMFKPSPIVYQHFVESTQSQKESCCLISGNPFDVLGALHFGMQAIWVDRSRRGVFDPWGPQPTATIGDLSELSSVL